MDKLWEYIQKEWGVLKGAPGAFVMLLVIAFGSACLFFGWLHAERFANKDTLNDLLKERIEKKDDQLTDYRLKNLDLQNQLTAAANLPSKQISNSQPKREQLRHSATRFSDATNKELTAMSGKLAENILSLSHTVEEKYLNPATRDNSVDWTRVAIREYEDKYEADAIVLRDEMLARLPLVQRSNTVNSSYQTPTNPYGLTEVAEDLKRLGLLLPAK